MLVYSSTCIEGDSIDFGHPCPAKDCYFTKLFQIKNIYIGGSVIDPRFAMSDEGTHIILKVCTKDDDGSYVWRCAECDAKEFHLLVVKETR